MQRRDWYWFYALQTLWDPPGFYAAINEELTNLARTNTITLINQTTMTDADIPIHNEPLFGAVSRHAASVVALIRSLTTTVTNLMAIGLIFNPAMYDMHDPTHIPFIGQGPQGIQVMNPVAGENLGIRNPLGALAFGLVAVFQVRLLKTMTARGNAIWPNKYTPKIVLDYLTYAMDRVTSEYTLFHVAYDLVFRVIAGDDDFEAEDVPLFHVLFAAFFYRLTTGFLTQEPELADEIVLEWSRRCTGIIPCSIALEFKLEYCVELVMLSYCRPCFLDSKGRLISDWFNKIDDQYKKMICCVIECYIKVRYPELHTWYHPDPSITEDALDHYEWEKGTRLLHDSDMQLSPHWLDTAVWVHDPTGYPLSIDDVVPGSPPAPILQPSDMDRFRGFFDGAINHNAHQARVIALQTYMTRWNTPAQSEDEVNNFPALDREHLTD